MKFVSTRIITADVKRLVDFYEMVTERLRGMGKRAVR